MRPCRITLTFGAAAGGLLAAALLPLATSATATADPADVTTQVLGTSPVTDTIVSDPDFSASDSFLSTPIFDNEFYLDPNTNTFADIVTIPGVMQDVFSVGPLFSGEPAGFEFFPLLNPADFFNPDYFFVTAGF